MCIGVGEHVATALACITAGYRRPSAAASRSRPGLEQVPAATAHLHTGPATHLDGLHTPAAPRASCASGV